MNYSDTLEALNETYKPKGMKILNAIANEARSRGLVCDDPFDMSSDDYRWSLLIREKGSPPDSGVDVTITIAESNEHDGEGDGVNFVLDMTGYGGRIVGGVAPYNFTSAVWVEAANQKAVATRWETFTGCFTPETILDEIQAFNAHQAR